MRPVSQKTAKQASGPALEKNAIVLCDRFYDSTVAYQGYGSGIDINIIEALYKTIFQQFLPYLTFILYADYDVIEARRKMRNLSDNTKQDNFESMDKSFYSRVHNGFMEIAKNNPERCILVDVNKTLEEIIAEIMGILKDRGVV